MLIAVWYYLYSGDADKTISHLLQAYQLNPRDPRNHAVLGVLARAYLNAGDYENAISWARKATVFRSDFVEVRLIAASALGHLGRLPEAQKAVELCEGLRKSSSKTGLVGERRFHFHETKKLATANRERDPLRTAHYLEGLRKARSES